MNVLWEVAQQVMQTVILSVLVFLLVFFFCFLFRFQESSKVKNEIDSFSPYSVISSFSDMKPNTV
jgi:hypothetical protein